MKLVVIEGIGKRETVQKYLGEGYEVLATKGHVRDLPAKTLAVDMTNNFAPKYEIMPDKKAIIKELKAKAKNAEQILLATDPDREGEAISWHIAYILGLDCNKDIRIEFNEISKNAVQHALTCPRPINQNLVNAQQARRVLDRLVGYKISPIISKKIKPKLSAGRVQSVTLKLIVEREREIQNFKPEEYWNITAFLTKTQNGTESLPFKSSLYEKEGKKFKVGNEQEKDKVLNDLDGAVWKVKNIKKSITKTHAPAPYITSTMQQDALNKLGMNLKRTSSAAQNLYEGVNVEGEGKIALITYIRTDSVRVSPEAQIMAKEYIVKTYGEKFIPDKPNFYKSKKSAQDAHEAIRPINLNITPAMVKSSLSTDNYKLYKLIYERFLASQMSEAKYNSVSVEIEANNYQFKATGRTVLFAGYTAVYQDFVDNNDKEDSEQALLPEMNENDILNKKEIKAEQKFTKPPARYTEASLVKTMEDKGIGRPATYTPTIVLLENREYTEKEGKQIKPTELGCIVCDTLIKYFPDIMDIKFTAEMEDKLDDISVGTVDWQKMIVKFYDGFRPELEKASGDPDKVEMPVEVTDIKCDKCGSFMVVRNGKYGKFLACPNYPECKNIKSIEVVVGVCPNCGKNLIERYSKKGKKFYGCSGYPNCDFVAWDMPTNEKCPKCQGLMLKKVGESNIKYYCQKCNYTRYEKLQTDEE